MKPSEKGSVTKAEYMSIHTWLRNEYGKADRCENSICVVPNGRFEWALIKGFMYEKKRENFWRLCKSCHAKYDFTEKTREKCSKRMIGNRFSNASYAKQGLNSKSRKLSPQQVIEIKKRVSKGEYRVNLAKEFKVSHTTINRIINGSRWKNLKEMLERQSQECEKRSKAMLDEMVAENQKGGLYE